MVGPGIPHWFPQRRAFAQFPLKVVFPLSECLVGFIILPLPANSELKSCELDHSLPFDQDTDSGGEYADRIHYLHLHTS